MNTEKQYKAIFVKNETHDKFKKLAEEDGRTFDKFLDNLLVKYENSNNKKKYNNNSNPKER